MNRLKAFLVFAIAIVMIFSALALVGNGTANATNAHVGYQPQSASQQRSSQAPLPTSSIGTQAATSTQSGSAQKTATILSELKSAHVPTKYAFLPNFNLKNGATSTVSKPSYETAPAPMGIADYGVYNNSGVLTPYNYTTTSFAATTNVSDVQPFYSDANAPHSFGIQLNAVLHNVTLFGTKGYSFWTQNVVEYSSMSHEFYFVDNIWNFSSAAAYMSPNALLAHGPLGTLVPGVLYYAVMGPIQVTMPFNLVLYLNATTPSSGTYKGDNIIYYNYSLSSYNATNVWSTMSGSYDFAVFNSSGNAAPASYLISGYSSNDYLGFIPADAEVIVGGPGGGSNTNFNEINMTMQLQKMTTNGYQNVKSAYNAGSQTGETAVGANDRFGANAVAHLQTGPSIVEGMWNITGATHEGYTEVIGASSSPTAFMFISQGNKFENNTSAMWASTNVGMWAPMNASGVFYYNLSPNYNYNFTLERNWYFPLVSSFYATGSVLALGVLIMSIDPGSGIYTPVYANGNGQLRELSANSPYSAGNGTASNPWIIEGDSGGTLLSPLFSEVNDYSFPVFNGIQVVGTTNYSVFCSFGSISNGPSFVVKYAPNVSKLFANSSTFDLPSVNYLQMFFYNDSHLIIANDAMSGWFFWQINLPAYSGDQSSYFYYNELANMELWNVTNSLICADTFFSMGSSMLIYNANNTSSNNTVDYNYFVPVPFAFNYPNIMLFGTDVGLSVYSSGNYIYKNYFETIVVSPSGMLGDNIYNGANSVYTDIWNSTWPNGNGWIDYAGQSGNLSNETAGVSYNEFGLIQSGTDMYPSSLIYASSPFSSLLAPLNLTEGGLSSGASWTLEVPMPNPLPIGGDGMMPLGTYTSANVTLLMPVTASFYEANYILGTSLGSDYIAQGAVYYAQPGYLFNESMAFQYTYGETVSVVETGLSSGVDWGLAGMVTYLNGTTEFVTMSGSGQSLQIPMVGPGTNYFALSTPSGFTAASSVVMVVVTGDSSAPVVASVTYVQDTYTVTVTVSGLPSGTSWNVTFDSKLYTSTNTSITVTGLLPGSYSYSFGNVSGYTAPSSGSISVTGNGTLSAAFAKGSSGTSSPTGISGAAIIYIAGGTVGGLVVGGLVMYLLGRKPKP